MTIQSTRGNAERFRQSTAFWKTWLAGVTGTLLLLGVILYFKVGPVAGLIDRLQSMWTFPDGPSFSFSSGWALPDGLTFNERFGAAMIAWAGITLYLLINDRRRWFPAMALAALGGGAWLINEAQPFWTDMAVVTSILGVGSATLPLLMLGRPPKKADQITAEPHAPDLLA